MSVSRRSKIESSIRSTSRTTWPWLAASWAIHRFNSTSRPGLEASTARICAADAATRLMLRIASSDSEAAEGPSSDSPGVLLVCCPHAVVDRSAAAAARIRSLKARGNGMCNLCFWLMTVKLLNLPAKWCIAHEEQRGCPLLRLPPALPEHQSRPRAAHRGFAQWPRLEFSCRDADEGERRR